MSFIMLELRKAGTRNTFEREVGVFTEFFTDGDAYRKRFISEWIAERGNPQHGATLEAVGYAAYTSHGAPMPGHTAHFSQNPIQ